jgi:hypothetical protein
MRHEFIEGPVPNYRASRRYLIVSIVVMWFACFFAGFTVGYTVQP